MAKLNANGKLIWVNDMVADNAAKSYGVSALPDGSAVIAGFYQGTAKSGAPPTLPAHSVFGELFVAHNLDIPTAPIGVRATASNGTATVSWTSRAGATVSSFIASRGGRRCTAHPPKSSCAVTGLSATKAYAVTVAATNA